MRHCISSEYSFPSTLTIKLDQLSHPERSNVLPNSSHRNETLRTQWTTVEKEGMHTLTSARYVRELSTLLSQRIGVRRQPRFNGNLCSKQRMSSSPLTLTEVNTNQNRGSADEALRPSVKSLQEAMPCTIPKTLLRGALHWGPTRFESRPNWSVQLGLHFAKFGFTIGSQNIKPLHPSEDPIWMVEMNLRQSGPCWEIGPLQTLTQFPWVSPKVWHHFCTM
jgi:hypothetical protein